MKNLIATILILLSLSSFAQQQVDSSRVIKVLTFNILHGANTTGNFDLDIIARVINEAEPDLVALQEVDYKTRRAHRYDLVTELGWRTKMAPLFGKAMDYDDGEYGEGILSKSSYHMTRNVALPHSPKNEPRTALEATIILNTNDTISFIGTHLEHSKDESDRIDQAQKIVDFFKQNRYPTILAGDLNAIPNSTPIKILESHFKSTYDSNHVQGTYPSSYPTKKIDYIMYYPADRWKVLSTEVIQDTIASDHCAYLVTFELLK